MKTNPLLIALISFVSCISQKNMQTKFFTDKEGYKYEFIVPEGYIKEEMFYGSSEHCQEYCYPDSSIFYVTTFRNTYNYEEIRKQHTYYERFNALNTGDTITLYGIDKQGLYWKDRLLTSGVTIGYSHVPINKRGDFEKCIFLIKKVK